MLGAGSGSVITDLNRLASHQSLLALTFVTSVPLFDQSCTLTDNRAAYLIVTCLSLVSALPTTAGIDRNCTTETV